MLKVSVISPEASLFEGEASSVVAPAFDGEVGILTGHALYLHALGIGMAVYGMYVCYLMLRRPNELATTENHVSWAHMYRMMFVLQIGFALAYLL